MIINYNKNIKELSSLTYLIIIKMINSVNAFRDWIFLPRLGFSVLVLKKVSGKYLRLEENYIFWQISHLSLFF